jgi:hypothetical protein
MAAGSPFWAGYSKETKGRVRPGARDGRARLRRRHRHRTSRSESQAGRHRRHWVRSLSFSPALRSAVHSSTPSLPALACVSFVNDAEWNS